MKKIMIMALLAAAAMMGCASGGGSHSHDEHVYSSGTMGLSAHCSDVIAYTTPKDYTANTNFIKSLIGFFRRMWH